MDKDQSSAEIQYRLSAIILDDMKKKGAITLEEYNSARTILAEHFKAPIGLLEAKEMLWEREK